MLQLHDYYDLTTESIDHQYGSSFGAELEAELTKLRQYQIITNSLLDQSLLNRIIKKHTGLSVHISTEPRSLELFVYYPDINKNNLILNELMKHYASNIDAEGFLKAKHFVDGVVNLKTGMVSGDFSNIFSSICIGEYYITKSSNYTAAEIAACLMHEVGHIIVYFEMLVRCTRTNYILAEGTKRLLLASNKEQRTIILEDVGDALGTTIIDKDKLAIDKKTAEGYQVIILNTAVQASLQQCDLNMYDSRSFEQLADTFVSRHGYSRALATGLNKMYLYSNTRAYITPEFNTFLMLLPALRYITGSTLATAGFFVLGGGLWALAAGIITALGGIYKSTKSLDALLIMGNPLVVKYDSPQKRILKIKHQINDALKDQTLSKQRKQLFLNDYAEINTILNNLYDNIGENEVVWKLLFSSSRKQAAEINKQQELEALLNNDLFTAVAALQVATTD